MYIYIYICIYTYIFIYIERVILVGTSIDKHSTAVPIGHFYRDHWIEIQQLPLMISTIISTITSMMNSEKSGIQTVIIKNEM